MAVLTACVAPYPTVPHPPPPKPVAGIPSAPEPPPLPLEPRPGTTEAFTARLAGITAGTASLRVLASPGDTRLITLELESAEWLRALFHVKETVAVCYNPQSGRPMSAVYEAEEGDDRQVLRQLFDDDRGQVILDFRAEDDARSGIVDISGVTDPLSLLFKARDLPLIPGFELPFDVLIGARLRTVSLRVVGPENEGARWRVDIEIDEFHANGEEPLFTKSAKSQGASGGPASERLSAWIQPGLGPEGEPALVRITVPTPLGTLTLDRDPVEEPSTPSVAQSPHSPASAIARAD